MLHYDRSILNFLAQFQDFINTIHYYLFKYAENKVVLLTYVLASTALLVLIYRFMSRKK